MSKPVPLPLAPAPRSTPLPTSSPSGARVPLPAPSSSSSSSSSPSSSSPSSSSSSQPLPLAPPPPPAIARPERVSVVSTRTHELKYILYQITVQYSSGIEWSLERRFSDFEALRARLLEFVSGVDLPPLPAKTLTRSLDAEFVHKRRLELERWLQHVHRHEAIRRSSLYQLFLSIDEHRGLAALDAHLPEELTAIVDPHFGINHCVYHQLDCTMFTACEDIHLLSKIERKLTNLRLPWEKQGGMAPLGCFSTWKIDQHALREERAREVQQQQRLKEAATAGGGRGAGEEQQQTTTSMPKPRCVIYYPVAATSVCIVPATSAQPQRLAFVGLHDGHVMAYFSDATYENFTQISDHTAHQSRVTSMAYAARKLSVLSVGTDNHLSVIDLHEKRVRYSIAVGAGLTSSHASLSCVRVDDEYERVFISSSSSAVFIYSTAMLPQQQPMLLHALHAHTAPIKSLAFVRAESLLLTGSDDFAVGVWSIAPGAAPTQVARSRLSGLMINGPQKSITAITFANATASSPSPSFSSSAIRQVITGTDDGFCCAWSIQTGKLCYVWKAHAAGITQLLFDPSTRTLITSSLDGKVKLFHLKSDKEVIDALEKLPPPPAKVAPVMAVVPEAEKTKEKEKEKEKEKKEEEKALDASAMSASDMYASMMSNAPVAATSFTPSSTAAAEHASSSSSSPSSSTDLRAPVPSSSSAYQPEPASSSLLTSPRNAFDTAMHAGGGGLSNSLSAQSIDELTNEDPYSPSSSSTSSSSSSSSYSTFDASSSMIDPLAGLSVNAQPTTKRSTFTDFAVEPVTTDVDLF